MNVLVIGSGGREHALAWKIRQSPRCGKLWCIPGNAGTAAFAATASLDTADHAAVTGFCRTQGVDLVVVGPEQPLVDGLADRLAQAGVPVIGPGAEGALLEGSKLYAKEFMAAAGLPTARYHRCHTAAQAREAVSLLGLPVVIKADGLAAGKGVVVCETEADAVEAIDRMLVDRVFGEAGAKLLVEEFLEGEEASYIVLVDGDDFVPFASSQDHKPVYDGDQGPNTGGMGAYSPAPVLSPALEREVIETMVRPLCAELKRRDIHYRGFLYIGLMITRKGPRILEFNVRMGDPETQPLMMRLQGDLLNVFEAMCQGRLNEVSLSFDPRPAVCVVMASGGYPGAYRKGLPLTGLDRAALIPDVEVFHAGTALSGDTVVTSGGRVLGVTALGDTLGQAIDRAYQAVGCIRFDEEFHRTDIGAKGMKRLREDR